MTTPASGPNDRRDSRASQYADAAFSALRGEGGVRSIHTLEATLEDVFLRVTGHYLAGDATCARRGGRR